MANPSAEDNQAWVRDRIAEAGLTEQTERDALAVIEFRQELGEL